MIPYFFIQAVLVFSLQIYIPHLPCQPYFGVADLTGTAVGIVSSGIQASNRITQFYNQWKEFSSDAQSTYRTVPSC
jgi:hypothetical protein